MAFCVLPLSHAHTYTHTSLLSVCRALSLFLGTSSYTPCHYLSLTLALTLTLVLLASWICASVRVCPGVSACLYVSLSTRLSVSIYTSICLFRCPSVGVKSLKVVRSHSGTPMCENDAAAAAASSDGGARDSEDWDKVSGSQDSEGDCRVRVCVCRRMLYACKLCVGTRTCVRVCMHCG